MSNKEQVLSQIAQKEPSPIPPEFIAALHQSEELAGDAYFQSLRWWMGDRIDPNKDNVPWDTERIDLSTGLFPIERYGGKEGIGATEFLEKCQAYYTPEAMKLIKKSLWLAMIVHQEQYRGTGEPYSIHLLAAASTMVGLKQDGIATASALLHDSHEDHEWVTLELLAEIHPKIADTVEGLTKIKNLADKELSETQTQLKIIAAGEGNPRVPIIKIAGDVLHNMRTLDGLKRRRRIVKIGEAESLWVPLAQHYGLFKTAREIGDAALEHVDEKDRRHVARIKEYTATEFPAEYIKRVHDDLDTILDDFPAQTFVRRPTVSEIYYSDPKKEHITPESLFLHADIVLSEKMGDITSDNTGRLAEVMGNIAIRFAARDDFPFRREEAAIIVPQLREALKTGETDSLAFDVFHVSERKTPRKLHVRVFPHAAYQREIADITACCRSPLIDASLDETIRDNPKYVLATEKLKQIDAQYRNAVNVMGEGDPASALVVRLQRRIRHDDMIVLGVDQEGKTERWPIAEGSTVIAYALDIEENIWSHAKSAKIIRGGIERTVPFDEVLQPGDQVRILFDTTPQWNPEFIHGLVNDPEMANRVRRHIRRIIKQEALQRPGPDEVWEGMPMYDKVQLTGVQQVEKRLRPDNAMLLVGLSSVRKQIFNRYRKLKKYKDWEGVFFYRLGMGEIPEQFIEEIIPAIEQENLKMKRPIRIGFKGDQAGILYRIAGETADMGISIRRSELHIIGARGSTWVDIYIHEDALPKRGEFYDAVRKNRDIRELGLVWMEQ